MSENAPGERRIDDDFLLLGCPCQSLGLQVCCNDDCKEDGGGDDDDGALHDDSRHYADSDYSNIQSTRGALSRTWSGFRLPSL